MPCWMESAMLLQRASRMLGKPAVAMEPAASQSWTQQHHLRASAGVLKYAHCQKTGSLSQECHAGWNQQCSCRELLECLASLQLQWGLQHLSLGHSSIISVHRQAYSNMLTARKQDHCLRNAMLDGISNALAEGLVERLPRKIMPQYSNAGPVAHYLSKAACHAKYMYGLS